MMKSYGALLLAAVAAQAAENAPMAQVHAAVEVSLARQWASVAQQLRSIGTASFFLLPPPEPVGATLPGADCDPVPEDQLRPLVEEAARREALDPNLLRSIIRQESASHACAVSPKGALGLMQLMPATAAELGVVDPFDPRQNVFAGARHLKQLLARYGGDVAKALAAYNAGASRVDEAGGVPAIPETLNYVRGIMTMLSLR